MYVFTYSEIEGGMEEGESDLISGKHFLVIRYVSSITRMIDRRTQVSFHFPCRRASPSTTRLARSRKETEGEDTFACRTVPPPPLPPSQQ